LKRASAPGRGDVAEDSAEGGDAVVIVMIILSRPFILSQTLRAP
jgi:hypothetical protein